MNNLLQSSDLNEMGTTHLLFDGLISSNKEETSSKLFVTFATKVSSSHSSGHPQLIRALRMGTGCTKGPLWNTLLEYSLDLFN